MPLIAGASSPSAHASLVMASFHMLFAIPFFVLVRIPEVVLQLVIQFACSRPCGTPRVPPGCQDALSTGLRLSATTFGTVLSPALAPGGPLLRSANLWTKQSSSAAGV